MEKATVIRCLLKAKDAELPYRHIHDELLKVLKKFEGKKPTKRIATALQKEHPSWTVYWEVEYGMYKVKVWGGDSGVEYNKRYNGLIAYESTPVVDSEKFDKRYDSCCGEAARKREEDLLKACADAAIVDEVLQVALMVKAVQDAKKNILKKAREEHGLTVESNLDKLIGSVE